MDRAPRPAEGGGAWIDLGLYAFSALFAWWTAAASTLAPHRAWGSVAVWGYLAAAAVTLVLLWRGAAPLPRAVLTAATWVATCLVPLVVQAVQRAHGRLDRAQEEVLVVEQAGQRLLDHATPYLSRSVLEMLPDPLLGYVPYQPGMAVFGVPRALDPGAAWWSDARVWFAIATIAALVAMRGVFRDGWGVRALQAVTVLPVAALTLATGGDDLPVLVLCLLGLWLAARGDYGWSGVALGVAASLKLFAWPVALVLAVVGRGRFLLGAIAIPVLTALPVLLRDAGAMVENVVAFPFGHGLVTSPAASPLPGHLIATSLPGGDVIAKVLLGLAVAGVLAYLVRRPPRTAADAAAISGVALLVAMLLLPATRFGYLLYPAALLLWVPSLRRVAREA